MNTICFSSVANAGYQKYIPWFFYYVRDSYPLAEAIVFVSGKVHPLVRKAIDIFDPQQFRIIPNSFAGRDCRDPDVIKCLRWLNPVHDFCDAEYMHIGDVDMAICHESPSFVDQHAAHCRKTGLPYSNFVRPIPPTRLSGVHVVHRDWFRIMEPMIASRLAGLRIDRRNRVGVNEQFLYRMVCESDLGVPPIDLYNTYHQHVVASHHHGIHIRLAEHRGIPGIRTVSGHQLYMGQIARSIDDTDFQKLNRIFPLIGRHFILLAQAFGGKV